jgi:multiple sugar transport system permease protein
MGFDAVEMTAGKNARPVVMFIQTWMWFGNTMIMLMSGIMGISPSLFEAADIDGASSMQTFWRVTLPLLSPIMVYTVVTSMIGGLQMFDIPFLYHEGTIDNNYIRTVAVYILKKYQNQNGYQFGYAGAASVILFVFTAALGSITFIINRDKDEVLKRKQRKMLIKQAKAKKSQFGGLGI